ncbi:MAG: MFS transporter, partial [Leptospiraceae bacterium]|nr:MFS transporter [Leptospiraceae bacterium]
GGVIRKISGKILEKHISIVGSLLLIVGFSFLSMAKTPIFTFFSLSFLSLGSALLNPSLSSLVSIFSTEEDQGKTLGIFRGLGSLARALSPFLFSILYFQFGPGFGFLTSGILSGIVLVLLFFVPQKGNSYAKAF